MAFGSPKKLKENALAILNGAPVMLWLSGADTKCTWVNDRWIEFSGQSLADNIGIGWSQAVHKEDLDRCYKSYIDAFNARQPYEIEFRVRRHDGEYRWVQFISSPHFEGQEFLGYIGVGTDIHERHLSQERRRKSEETLSKIFEDAAVGMVQLDIDGRVLRANQKFSSMLGYTSQEVVGQSLGKFTHADDLEGFRKNLKSLVNGDIPFVEDEKRFIHKNGQVVTVLHRGNPIKSWLGHVVAIGAQVVDITNKVMLEKALIQANARFGMALSARKMGVWEWDLNKDFLTWDEAHFGLFEITNESFKNNYRSWEARVEVEDRARLKQELTQAKRHGLSFETNFRIRTADEKIKHIRSTAFIERDGAGKPVRFVGLSWDVTDEVGQTEALDRQRSMATNAAKMAALGEMAAGMAHEINNPLAIIMGKIQQMQNMAEDGDIDKEKLITECGKVQMTVNRIASIIRGLRSFSRDDRRDTMTLATVDDMVKDTLSFCQARFKSHGVVLDIPEHLPKLKFECHPGQISQIILNLLNNAFDAVQAVKDQWIKLEIFVLNEELVFRVTDSGPGVSAEIAERIFQPFFTTKPAGKGIGLGLSISKGLCENHGGKLSLISASSPCTFEARFPHRRSAEKAA